MRAEESFRGRVVGSDWVDPGLFGLFGKGGGGGRIGAVRIGWVAVLGFFLGVSRKEAVEKEANASSEGETEAAEEGGGGQHTGEDRGGWDFDALEAGGGDGEEHVNFAGDKAKEPAEFGPVDWGVWRHWCVEEWSMVRERAVVEGLGRGWRACEVG